MSWRSFSDCELEPRWMPALPVLVQDVNPTNPGSNLGTFCAVGATLFFRANDGATGHELWKSDGTSSGTQLVRNINEEIGGGLLDSNPRDLVNLNGTLLFAANSGSAGYELWRSDGTSSGTQLVRD